MDWSSKELKRTANGPAPQYGNTETGEFQVLEGGGDGPLMDVKAIGKQNNPAAGADLAQSWSAVSLLKAAVAGIRSILTALGLVSVQVQNWPANQSVTLTGRNLTQAPVTGNKTITTTPALVFAGASKLAGRNYLYLPNPGPAYLRYGGASISTTVGTRLAPGDYRIFNIDPAANPDIYACMESGTTVADVEEGK